MDDDIDDTGPYNQRNTRRRYVHRDGRIADGNAHAHRQLERGPREEVRFDDRRAYRNIQPAYGMNGIMPDNGLHRSRPNFGEHLNNPHRGNYQQQGNRQFNENQRRPPRNQFLGFRKLEEISKTETKDTLTKLVENKKAFMELIQSPIDKLDMFVVVLEIIAKAGQSSFDETKSKLLLDVCNSQFIVSLKSYLIDLPYTQTNDKMVNNLFWKDPEAFWKNFVVFCECVVNTSPTLALNKCRSLIEATSIACLDGLKEKHGFVLSEELNEKMVELRERMVNFEKNHVKETQAFKKYNIEDGAPPEDFRELCIMPTREDLLHQRPYIRPNIVNGGYQDEEHYLDVQFRLLREDCFGPLREGLNQFLRDETRKRFDHIRVFRDVKFVRPYLSKTKIGSLVQIDVNSNKMFKRTNWSNNKRFIFGSLVLFTKDNCKTFIAATILDREDEYLKQGMIPISIIGAGFNTQLYNNDTYTMIESEVYFEPYYHVLKVLQDPTFPDHLAMKQYIVYVNPQPQHPSYLKEDTEYTVDIGHTREITPVYVETMEHLLMDISKDESDIEKFKFTVLRDETWPQREALSFNDSQYDAYKLALTHEFAVVQGPPGTGKTYLGIKVAKTLFENLNEKNGCLMLVICYTNHALDQFLEALLDLTDSIVRIGGQSRNEAMERINLKQLRRTISIHSPASKAFFDQKTALEAEVSQFKKSLVQLDILYNGVVKSNTVEDDILPIRFLCDYYKEKGLDSRQDPLFYWLFENNVQFMTYDIGFLFEEKKTENDFAKLEKESRRRTGVSLDDQDINNTADMEYRREISSFSVEAATHQIKLLVDQYRTAPEHIRRNIEYELTVLNSYRTMFNEMKRRPLRRNNMRITENTNFERISPEDRWSLYFSWIKNRALQAKDKVGQKQEKVNTATTMYDESRMMLDMQVLEKMRIVGMTTSGAARMRKLLQTLNPPIVIVEEAAEVLEQHIITSLTEGCKHLILIGDHQQLRPSASHMVLAKRYQLEVSLFERMITNGIHSRRLSVQHRMRPEIAALICPHIYPELENHPSVYEFPDVKGMTKNLFFFNHDFKEENVEDNMSRTNHREADITLALANYLVQQGYETEDVTILAAYKGQMFYMRKESEKYSHLKGVKITVVDNYQGEESKIILLSLVRNNDDNKIGFLGTANRICVALSRAKYGFYIFGNIEILKVNSDLWKNIAATLESNQSLGTTLTLQCQNHTDNMTIIEKVEDFQNNPEGGCLLRCDFNLPGCGHKCILFCHGYDAEHVTGATKCTQKCERIRCVLNHVCPKKCADECGPCMVEVMKTLPCGHDKHIYCHLEPEDPSIQCQIMVEVTLPDCKHVAKKQCYMDVKKVRCEVKCEFRIAKCGHSCMKACHVNDDPDHEKYICMKPCANAKLNCQAELVGDRGDHQCFKKCYETCDDCAVRVVKRRTKCKHLVTTVCSKDPDKELCIKKCARSLPCGHFCKKKCNETCGDCNQMVTKTITDCKHVVKIACKTEPTRLNCTMNCERTMSCGHKCKGLCSNECQPSECNAPSLRKFSSPCGHLVSLPCNVAKLPAAELKSELLLSVCSEKCSTELACGHACSGTCATCLQGRVHVACTQRCNQDNICGHQCEEPCNQICPPCKKQCEVKCVHNRCSNLCGAPCSPCVEKCERRCPHGACKNRCGEVCSRAACNEACPRQLPCGHACRGLCGEPCPPICKTCRPDEFPVGFLGEQFEDTDLFILLQDCGHVLEVENMDNLMMGDSETVKIRCCPFCRKPIINTNRYKDLVNATFKKEINPIKMKVYGTHKMIAETYRELRKNMDIFKATYLKNLQENKDIKHVFLNLESIIKTQKKPSKLQLDMELICLNILDMVSECYKSYVDNNATQLKDELAKQIKLICKIFLFQVKKGSMFKVSKQHQADVKLEIKRLNAIVQFAKLQSHTAYVTSKTVLAVLAAAEAATAAVFKPAVFKEEETIEALKALQEAVKVSNIVTKQQRDLIVKAIGLKSGHWYKCPNGHFYCIGECGGAMQVGRCAECGAEIGGTGHALLRNNAHAPEMDGSRYAAWSQEYNNMANFNL